jgi:signal transduction histidine kinase
LRVPRLAASPLKSRVAQRIFLLFVACALGPLVVFAFYGTWQTRRQVERQAFDGLRLEARAIGQNLVESLRCVEVDLHLLSGRLSAGGPELVEDVLADALDRSEQLQDRLDSLALVDRRTGAPLAAWGAPHERVELDAGQRDHLAAGRTLVREISGTPASLLLLLDVGPDVRAEARLRPEGVWDASEADADLVVLGAAGEVLYSSYGPGGDLSALGSALRANPANGLVAWSPRGEPELGAYRQLFLEPTYGTGWTVVCSHPDAEIFAVLASFQRGLLLTSLLTLWIVLYASVTTIRRRMVPIDHLRRAAHRMAEGDLGARVEITTDDEFRELGEAFNQMARSVRERTTQLEVANHVKNDFLAKMSHELRTPMTAILGYAEQARDPAVGADERERYLGIVARNGDHLLKVIDDILDVASIEANRASVDRAWCSPMKILEGIVVLLEPTAREKGIALRLEPPDGGDVPRRAWTDPTRLRQILLNLISNAIKFTEAGGADVRAARRTADGEDLLEVTVRDTGIGMTPEQARVVFDAFVQADDRMSRRFGGAGLGLAISRTYARHLGGDITCSSEPGRGSTFTLTIDLRVGADAPPAPAHEPPAARPAAPSQASQPAPEGELEPAPAFPRVAVPLDGPAPEGAASPLRVLVAEDVAVNRKLVVMILAKAGMEAAEAENGQVAYELALGARDRGEPFDAILMDMQMPVLDGYEATSRLRAEGYAHAIIALTSHSMPEERDRCLAAGCDEFQSKPIDRAKLLAAIERYAGSPV